MQALDIVQIVIAALQAVIQMFARGFTKEEALRAIQSLSDAAAQIDADVDAIAGPPPPPATATVPVDAFDTLPLDPPGVPTRRT